MTQDTMTQDISHYDFCAIEKQQQALWEADSRYQTTNDDNGKPTRYMLSMFPYPSGKLHMGHVRNYAITDVLSRYYRLKGYDVMQPMGWDAFGLPAENAAIANQVAPAKWTYANIENMKRQLKSLGLSIDWSREFATCSPDYYRWEQWLFIQLYKKGLVYKKLATVNWDPVDNTVLANEQVIDGRGWRSGAVVEKRDIPMYYFKITEYADELLEGLAELEGKWPKQVIAMQKNWIGRSYGMDITFTFVKDSPYQDSITVFSTRPDTLMGASYLAVAPEHPLVSKASENNPDLQAFVAKCRQGSVAEADLAVAEKQGMPTGFFVNHPITGKPIPVWTANYILMSYGSGAVMGVPAHDERDFEFANKYRLPIIQVINNHPKKTYDSTTWQDWYGEKTGVLIHSDEFDGLTISQAFDAILSKLGPNAAKKTQYRLRDWGVSRQRYWGCPIPMINCDYCGTVPVDEVDLPVVLPTDIIPDGRGNPLKNIPDFVQTICPKCGQPAERETDTFDTFVESSWYAQRFASPHHADAMIDKTASDKWLPVDQYVGGIEHAVLHLLYARFFHKVMRDEGLVAGNEPFANLLAQGMVLATTFYREHHDGSTSYYFPHEINVDAKTNTATLIADGKPVNIGKTEKMSKSKNNGVDPESIISEYGADTARLYTLFTAPADQTLEWSSTALKGPHNFIKKVWRLTHEYLANGLDNALSNGDAANRQQGILPLFTDTQKQRLSKQAKALRKKTHETISKIDVSLGEHLALNTPVSTLMELANELGNFGNTAISNTAVGNTATDNQADILAYQEGLLALLILLAIFAPHVGEHLLGKLGVDTKRLSYPMLDSSALTSDSITMVVQVNGKIRGQMEIPTNTDNDTIKQMALSLESVSKHLSTKPKKIIVVPNKLVSIVV